MTRAQLKHTAHSSLECDLWNGSHPVGIDVVVARDNGEQHRGKTRSQAYVSNSGDAVIFVTGISGYYLLDRVTAIDVGSQHG